MEIKTIFKEVRDIPYEITVDLRAQDKGCVGKHQILKGKLEAVGYKTRWIVCSFGWDSLPLPEEVLVENHDKESTHAYLEVFVGNNWVKVDATWDSGLKHVFEINEWDGVTHTKIAVPVRSVFSVEESDRIMKGPFDTEETAVEIENNRNFFEAFNKWLERQRNASS